MHSRVQSSRRRRCYLGVFKKPTQKFEPALVSAPWRDSERLFHGDADYFTARNTAEMISRLRAVLKSPVLADSITQNALTMIRARHTCSHRADQLLAIAEERAESTATGTSA